MLGGGQGDWGIEAGPCGHWSPPRARDDGCLPLLPLPLPWNVTPTAFLSAWPSAVGEEGRGRSWPLAAPIDSAWLASRAHWGLAGAPGWLLESPCAPAPRCCCVSARPVLRSVAGSCSSCFLCSLTHEARVTQAPTWDPACICDPNFTPVRPFAHVSWAMHRPRTLFPECWFVCVCACARTRVLSCLALPELGAGPVVP